MLTSVVVINVQLQTGYKHIQMSEMPSLYLHTVDPQTLEERQSAVSLPKSASHITKEIALDLIKEGYGCHVSGLV